MADTFSVDTNALGQIPSLLQGAHGWLTASHVSPEGRGAAAAAPGPAAGISGFAASLDLFLRSGAVALASDMRALEANRSSYDRTDLGAACLLGGGR